MCQDCRTGQSRTAWGLTLGPGLLFLLLHVSTIAPVSNLVVWCCPFLADRGHDIASHWQALVASFS